MMYICAVMKLHYHLFQKSNGIMKVLAFILLLIEVLVSLAMFALFAYVVYKVYPAF